MTPERKEELKTLFNTMKFLPYAAASDLLAALEEAQQRVEIAERMVGAVEKLASDKHQELAEAQQTIARKQKVWQELKDIVSTNATGGRGEDINDYDIMLNIMKSLYPDTPAQEEGK